MAKKNKIAMKHDEDFELLDAELDTAMNQLDTRNQQIEKLLESHFETGDASQKEKGPGVQTSDPATEKEASKENRSAAEVSTQ